eukprot:TRINITY_DN14550_c0_g1_i1.p1 TRINITY_DN14550_c0_g1~~TRINITY_DN14550_c0_g1_i1.p1  ORF type:complete len:687 (+),score=183.63 TRINITY_DN14550_c0_g1_i1:52-2112(+)
MVRRYQRSRLSSCCQNAKPVVFVLLLIGTALVVLRGQCPEVSAAQLISGQCAPSRVIRVQGSQVETLRRMVAEHRQKQQPGLSRAVAEVERLAEAQTDVNAAKRLGQPSLEAQIDLWKRELAKAIEDEDFVVAQRLKLRLRAAGVQVRALATPPPSAPPPPPPEPRPGREEKSVGQPGPSASRPEPPAGRQGPASQPESTPPPAPPPTPAPRRSVAPPVVIPDAIIGRGEVSSDAGLTVRAKETMQSDFVQLLQKGTRVAWAEQSGRRVRLVEPLEGWASVSTLQGGGLISRDAPEPSARTSHREYVWAADEGPGSYPSRMLERWELGVDGVSFSPEMAECTFALASRQSGGAMRLQFIDGSLWVTDLCTANTHCDIFLRAVKSALLRNRIDYGSLPTDFDITYYPGNVSDHRALAGVEDACPAGTPVGPLLANSASPTPTNALVPVPDYSYYLSDEEAKAIGWEEWGPYIRKSRKTNERNLDQKSARAVWRGHLVNWEQGNLSYMVNWGGVRASLLKDPGDCDAEGMIDAQWTELTREGDTVRKEGAFVSHRDMCDNYQVIVSVPRSGAWAVGTKFALTCGSVVAVPEGTGEFALTGLGLKPHQHYIPISNDTAAVCGDLKRVVTWVREHPEEAQRVADNGRSAAHLGLRKVSLNSALGSLLKLYASRFTGAVRKHAGAVRRPLE